MRATIIGGVCIAFGFFISTQINHGGPFFVALAAVVAYWVFRFIQKRGLIRMLLNEPKKVIAGLTIWTTLHMGLWVFNGGESSHSYFWPFGDSDLRYYGSEEFFIYAIIPWLAYAVYRLLMDKKAGLPPK